MRIQNILRSGGMLGSNPTMADMFASVRLGRGTADNDSVYYQTPSGVKIMPLPVILKQAAKTGACGSGCGCAPCLITGTVVYELRVAQERSEFGHHPIGLEIADARHEAQERVDLTRLVKYSIVAFVAYKILSGR